MNDKEIEEIKRQGVIENAKRAAKIGHEKMTAEARSERGRKAGLASAEAWRERNM